MSNKIYAEYKVRIQLKPRRKYFEIGILIFTAHIKELKVKNTMKGAPFVSLITKFEEDDDDSIR